MEHFVLRFRVGTDPYLYALDSVGVKCFYALPRFFDRIFPAQCGACRLPVADNEHHHWPLRKFSYPFADFCYGQPITVGLFGFHGCKAMTVVGRGLDVGRYDCVALFVEVAGESENKELVSFYP
jgi:hypothetical protein